MLGSIPSRPKDLWCHVMDPITPPGAGNIFAALGKQPSMTWLNILHIFGLSCVTTGRSTSFVLDMTIFHLSFQHPFVVYDKYLDTVIIYFGTTTNGSINHILTCHVPSICVTVLNTSISIPKTNRLPYILLQLTSHAKKCLAYPDSPWIHL